MKHIRLITFFATAALFAASGCGKTEVSEPAPEPGDPDRVIGNGWLIINEPHFILTFAQTTSIEARIDGTDIELLYFRGGKKGVSVDESRQIYNALYERYGDLTYDVERQFYGIYMGGFDFLMNNITSIQITCDKDFDAEHPAGMSLNDVCELFACSPRQYIASGYTEKYDWSQWPDEYPELSPYSEKYLPDYKPFRKLLAQCTPEDMVLMGDGCSTLCKLRFTHAPEQPNSTFTLTLTDESGEVITCLVPY